MKQVNFSIPLVPRKAVAEVSKAEIYRRGCLLRNMGGRANPLMDRKVVGASGYRSVYLSIYLPACLLIYQLVTLFKLFKFAKLVRLAMLVK